MQMIILTVRGLRKARPADSHAHPCLGSPTSDCAAAKAFGVAWRGVLARLLTCAPGPRARRALRAH
jgi:hypothetical protein